MSREPPSFRSAPAVGPAAGHPRAGLSLLEVLVAGGILVVGLSSIAALLPAAGSRLSQASQEDRAGIVAANARAEVANRGLAAVAVFSNPARACAFGSVATALVSNTSATSWQTTTGTASAVLAQRIDATRGFVLEDELVYRPPTTADTPLNTFVNSGTGPREYKEAISWGATLVPDASPAAAGGRATLGIAVFKKAGTCQELTLTGTSGAARYSTGASNGIADEATRKRFLAGCTHVLALTNPPQWRRIQASWTMPGPIVVATGTEQAESRQSFVVLDPPLTSGSTLTVVGFEHLIRVDQHRVTLE
jgi:Tfp pilus assembly protein PilV